MPDILCPQQHLQVAAGKRTDPQFGDDTVTRQWSNFWMNLHRRRSTLKRNDPLLDAAEHFVARADFWIALTIFQVVSLSIRDGHSQTWETNVPTRAADPKTMP